MIGEKTKEILSDYLTFVDTPTNISLSDYLLARQEAIREMQLIEKNAQSVIKEKQNVIVDAQSVIKKTQGQNKEPKERKEKDKPQKEIVSFLAEEPTPSEQKESVAEREIALLNMIAD